MLQSSEVCISLMQRHLYGMDRGKPVLVLNSGQGACLHLYADKQKMALYRVNISYQLCFIIEKSPC